MMTLTLLAAMRLLTTSCATVEAVECHGASGCTATLTTYEATPRKVVVADAPRFWSAGDVVGTHCNKVVR